LSQQAGRQKIKRTVHLASSIPHASKNGRRRFLSGRQLQGLKRQVSSYGGDGNFDTTTFWARIERKWVQASKNKMAHREAPYRMSRP